MHDTHTCFTHPFEINGKADKGSWKNGPAQPVSQSVVSIPMRSNCPVSELEGTCDIRAAQWTRSAVVNMLGMDMPWMDRGP